MKTTTQNWAKEIPEYAIGQKHLGDHLLQGMAKYYTKEEIIELIRLEETWLRGECNDEEKFESWHNKVDNIFQNAIRREYIKQES